MEAYLLGLLLLSEPLGASLLLRLALLEEGLGDQDLVVGGDSAAVTIRLVRSPAYTRYESESAG